MQTSCFVLIGFSFRYSVSLSSSLRILILIFPCPGILTCELLSFATRFTILMAGPEQSLPLKNDIVVTR